MHDHAIRRRSLRARLRAADTSDAMFLFCIVIGWLFAFSAVLGAQGW